MVSGSPPWHSEALHYLQLYPSQHMEALCSLPALYASVAAKHQLSIGQFHDGIRDMVQAGQIRLHPFTGSLAALEREEYALVMSKEVMYYVEVREN